MLLACCTSRAKEWERTETADLKRIKLTYHTSVTENPFTKSDLMKSILSDSAVLAARRCIGFVTVMVLAALPAIGAGSAKQAVRKDSDPSITTYNQGVELMLAKRFPEAQAKFEQAVKENPRFAEAHNNLGYTLRKQGAAIPSNYYSEVGPGVCRCGGPRDRGLAVAWNQKGRRRNQRVIESDRPV
jgi:tetratricopeptide (TPR) repeat protein